MTPDQLISTLQHAPQTTSAAAVTIYVLGMLGAGAGLAGVLAGGALVAPRLVRRVMIASLLAFLAGDVHAYLTNTGAHTAYVTQAVATYVQDTDDVTPLTPADLDEQPAGTPSTVKFDALRPDGARVHVNVTWGWGTNTPLARGTTLPHQSSPVTVTIQP